MMSRKYILVSGRVQGVGFRYHAMNLALDYHLTGWVRNLNNGAVEMEVQGEPESVDLFVQNLDTGTNWIRIDNKSVADTQEISGETAFRIRY
ncbi:MAG: acylphosphatase [Lachnospiraceae bacterium]|nr:acylphosphatase [Lachnospiraceae bacterium]